MIDPVDIMNEFTRYDPSKGQPRLDLPIPGYWFQKICALADRIAKAENRLMEVQADLEAYRDSGSSKRITRMSKRDVLRG